VWDTSGNDDTVGWTDGSTARRPLDVNGKLVWVGELVAHQALDGKLYLSEPRDFRLTRLVDG